MADLYQEGGKQALEEYIEKAFIILNKGLTMKQEREELGKALMNLQIKWSRG